MQVIGLPGQYGNTPAACFRRFEEGVYSISDVERVIEWGLIGGGTAEVHQERESGEGVQHSGHGGITPWNPTAMDGTTRQTDLRFPCHWRPGRRGRGGRAPLQLPAMVAHRL